jgi:outer membrane receptor protein involved in Fe transport
MAMTSAAMLTVVGGGVHAQTALAKPDAGPAASEEVVVTAQKRPSRALDVPASLTVVSANQLEVQGLTSLSDLTSIVPGLDISSRGAVGFNQIILRGITSGGQQTSPTVGIYVDDVPFGTASPAGTSSLQPDIDPADIQRIEVLRGPQGTLYGASTLGGLIKYVTYAPDADQFSGAASVGGTTVDNGASGASGRISVNVPIVEDKLAVRASAFSRFDPGYIDDPVDHNHDDNGSHVDGGRLSIGIYPTPQLSIRLDAFTQQSRTNATNSVDLNATTLQPLDGDLTNTRVSDDYFKSRYNLFSGTAKWDAGPVSLVSATGYSQITSNILFDFTPAYAFIIPLYSGGLFPTGDITGPQNFHSDKFTQEVRLDSNNWTPLNWRIGAFYTKEDFNIGTQVLGLNPITLQQLPSVFGPLSTAGTVASYEEEAVFGDARLAVTKTLELDGGVRWSHNDQSSVASSAGLLNSTTDPFTPTIMRGSSSESVVTFEASAKWTFAPDQMAYARVATGYRPGGPIGELPAQLAAGAPTSYHSDTVIDYEGGVKGLWLDKRLSLDADIFYIDWQHIQLPTLIAGFNVLSNGGGALSQGVEFNGSYAITPDLTVSLRTAYTDAHLTSEALVAGYAKGERLPAVPRWDVGGDIDYTHPLFTDVTGDLGMTVKFNSDREAGQALNPANPLVDLPGFTTVDLRAGAMWRRYRLDVYVRNVGDDRAYYNGSALRAYAGQNVPFTAIPIQPRTFGMVLSAKF